MPQLASVVPGRVDHHVGSTLLTLLFVPVMYGFLDDLHAFFGRRSRGGAVSS